MIIREIDVTQTKRKKTSVNFNSRIIDEIDKVVESILNIAEEGNLVSINRNKIIEDLVESGLRGKEVVYNIEGKVYKIKELLEYNDNKKE